MKGTKIKLKSFLALFLGLSVAANVLAERQISTEIDEVIVTAEKREQNIQDVPVAVSAMDAEALEKTFSRDIHDLAGMSPNLIIDPILGNGTTSISVRGMQLNDVEKSFDPAVAVYQDGIYLQSTTGVMLNIWDAERVEVLRGPQGTLFGRNTVGGLVHVIRAKPTGEMGGKMAMTLAEDEQVDLKATFNFPEFNNISTKVTVMSADGGDYFENVIRNEDEGGADLLQWSFGALWEPTDNFSMYVVYDDVDDKTPTRPVTCTTESPELFDAFNPNKNECSSVQDNDFHTKTYTSTYQEASVDLQGVSLNANWQLSDNHELVFVYGQREFDETAKQEFDGTSVDLFRTSRPATQEQESFELRLQSTYDWGTSTFGAYMYESEYFMRQNTWFFPLFDPTLADGNPLAGWFAAPNTGVTTETTAFFGQIDWDMTDNLTLTLGGRYVDEEKSVCHYYSTPYDPDGNVLTQGQFTDWDGFEKNVDPVLGGFGICPAIAQPFMNNDYIDAVTGQNATLVPETSWSEFTPKIGITYKMDMGIVFASYTEGFRSGGYNGRTTAAGNAGPYAPEIVESTEIGFKLSFLENTLQLNGTVFQTDYTNKQEDVILPDPVGATLTLVQNAAQATMDGVEMEMVWIPSEGLTLSANVGLLDASYESFTVLGTTGNPVDKSDFELRKAPDMTFGLNALYEHQLDNGHFLVTTLSYRWKDDFWVNGNTGGIAQEAFGGNPKHYPEDSLLIDAFGILDASINYETESWRISLFGKNLTDEAYFMHSVDVGGAYNSTPTSTAPIYLPPTWSFATINRPRYFGVEAQFKF